MPANEHGAHTTYAPNAESEPYRAREPNHVIQPNANRAQRTKRGRAQNEQTSTRTQNVTQGGRDQRRECAVDSSTLQLAQPQKQHNATQRNTWRSGQRRHSPEGTVAAPTCAAAQTQRRQPSSASRHRSRRERTELHELTQPAQQERYALSLRARGGSHPPAGAAAPCAPCCAAAPTQRNRQRNAKDVQPHERTRRNENAPNDSMRSAAPNTQKRREPKRTRRAVGKELDHSQKQNKTIRTQGAPGNGGTHPQGRWRRRLEPLRRQQAQVSTRTHRTTSSAEDRTSPQSEGDTALRALTRLETPRTVAAATHRQGRWRLVAQLRARRGTD